MGQAFPIVKSPTLGLVYAFVWMISPYLNPIVGSFFPLLGPFFILVDAISRAFALVGTLNLYRTSVISLPAKSQQTGILIIDQMLTHQIILGAISITAGGLIWKWFFATVPADFHRTVKARRIAQRILREKKLEDAKKKKQSSESSEDEMKDAGQSEEISDFESDSEVELLDEEVQLGVGTVKPFSNLGHDFWVCFFATCLYVFNSPLLEASSATSWNASKTPFSIYWKALERFVASLPGDGVPIIYSDGILVYHNHCLYFFHNV